MVGRRQAGAKGHHVSLPTQTHAVHMQSCNTRVKMAAVPDSNRCIFENGESCHKIEEES